MNIAVIDLFCGVGGLSYGFKAEGFDVLAGVDLDGTCQYAFEKNVGAKFAKADISKISGTKLKRVFEVVNSRHNVLVGCAPCTPFSLYASRYKKNEKNDSRWGLLNEFGRLAVTIKPDVISMENVPRLTKHNIFRQFVNRLRQAGYTVTYEVVRADYYGVPQHRQRLVLFASLHGKIEMPKPRFKNRPRTVRQAIGDLPPISAGEEHPDDALHVARGLSKRNLRRIRATQEGGSWRDWNTDLKLACHKRASGKTFRSVYGRMNWDAPSPVITTQCVGLGNGRFGHPEQDRAISLREAALLQSFPRKYAFVQKGATVSQVTIARHIGNAVPVKLARVVAAAIRNHLEKIDSNSR